MKSSLIRKKRVRIKIKKKSQRPRLSVFRSNHYLWAQIIDDEKGKTLVAASDFYLRSNRKRTPKNLLPSEKFSALSDRRKHTKTDCARLVGEILAQKAKKLGIKKVYFDRGSYQYHGRIKALAEGAREKGLDF